LILWRKSNFSTGKSSFTTTTTFVYKHVNPIRENSAFAACRPYATACQEHYWLTVQKKTLTLPSLVLPDAVTTLTLKGLAENEALTTTTTASTRPGRRLVELMTELSLSLLLMTIPTGERPANGKKSTAEPNLTSFCINET
jgi:hypothetical protein